MFLFTFESKVPQLHNIVFNSLIFKSFYVGPAMSWQLANAVPIYRLEVTKPLWHI